MDKNKERGAVIVEATISLPVYIFAIFIILSIVNICYIQSRIGNALNASAKEISQYTYLYYKFGGDKADAKSKEGTEESRKLSENTIDGLVSIMDSLSGAKKSANSGDFDQMAGQLNNSKGNINDLCDQYGDKIAKDPKQFVFGFAKLAFGELKEETKAYLGAVMAKAFMKKNLVASEKDDVDSFLQRYRVVNGMKGLDFSYTSLMPYGETDKIQLVCSYEVSVLKLLNIDFKFNFQNVARTRSWGNGISKAQGQTHFILNRGDYAWIGDRRVHFDANTKSFVLVRTEGVKFGGFTERDITLDPGTICYYQKVNTTGGGLNDPDTDRPVVWTGEEWLDMTKRDDGNYVTKYNDNLILFNVEEGTWYYMDSKKGRWLTWNSGWVGFPDIETS